MQCGLSMFIDLTTPSLSIRPCYRQAAPAALIARLRTLTRSRLLEVMGASMTVREEDLLLEKRTQVVAYFDAVEARRSLEQRLL